MLQECRRVGEEHTILPSPTNTMDRKTCFIIYYPQNMSPMETWIATLHADSSSLAEGLIEDDKQPIPLVLGPGGTGPTNERGGQQEAWYHRCCRGPPR